MAFGLIVIGDEILSGKRQDKHFAKVRELLAARGLKLAWVQYLGDERPRLISALAPHLCQRRHRVQLRRHRCDAG
jgi:molybdopterin-biosynthesis enzyme MoeA-like protein